VSANPSYRWAVLAAGTFAQTTYSAIWFGVAVMAPQLRQSLHLSLAETGLLISASLVGSVVSLIPWGLATDRVGERVVLLIGLTLCGTALLAASAADSFWLLVALLAFAGAAGASVQSASGRAVMHWFEPEQRGVALGLRQTAIPLSGFAISVARRSRWAAASPPEGGRMFVRAASSLCARLRSSRPPVSR
jgi:sugar phosphate permease